VSDARRNVDVRLSALRAVDTILAVLQSTFAQPDLIEGENPYIFIAGDAKGSRTWICDTEGRTQYDRTSGRMLMLVYRGDFSPQNLHLANRADGAWTQQNFSDLGNTTVYVQCEAGNKQQSEALASIVFQLIKRYRLVLMKEFDIYKITPDRVGAPAEVAGGTAQGKPWATTVAIQVVTQETYTIKQKTNDLNLVDVRQVYDSNLKPPQPPTELFTLDVRDTHDGGVAVPAP
jgi:hypothetical protein